MKINITDTIKNYDGEPVVEVDKFQRETPLTYRQVFITALNNPAKEETFTSEMREKSFEISGKLFAGKEIELTTTQKAYIIERVENIFRDSPLLVGRVKQLLDK